MWYGRMEIDYSSSDSILECRKNNFVLEERFWCMESRISEVFQPCFLLVLSHILFSYTLDYLESLSCNVCNLMSTHVYV